jgi:hypothetical protein
MQFINMYNQRTHSLKQKNYFICPYVFFQDGYTNTKVFKLDLLRFMDK